jgi:hypothetical protein
MQVPDPSEDFGMEGADKDGQCGEKPRCSPDQTDGEAADERKEREIRDDMDGMKSKVSRTSMLRA